MATNYLLVLEVLLFVQVNLHRIQERACPTIEINNRTEGVENFSNCSVIEGHMSILRFDNFPPWLTFPELVEITDYLFFYRVSGLSTFRHIFPKLAVIRGRQLFHSYALVVYEMMGLEELGLVNLMTIVRGTVRLEKNPLLCYVNTIDWALIMNSPIEGNFVLENRADMFCTGMNDCNMNCPVRQRFYSDGSVTRAGEDDERLCWSNEHCQKVCSSQHGSRCCEQKVSGSDECCSDQCLGGCSGSLPSQCSACLNVFHHGSCVAHCPPDMYKFVDRRCLTAAECVAMAGWKVVDLGDMRQCVDECPPGYVEQYDVENGSVCVYCGSQCVVECHQMVVDSIEAAERLRGCTVIRGVLEILLHARVDDAALLVESMGSIQVITDYLIVMGTLLDSISFLHNLTAINGHHLYHDRYSVVVRDNAMLQHMWDDSGSPFLRVERGRANILNNRKLCSNEINVFLEHTGLANRSMPGDIGGNRMDCGLTPDLQLLVLNTSESDATLQWNNATRSSRLNITGWVVHTRPTSDNEVKRVLHSDLCDSGGWRAHDMVYSDVGDSPNVILTIADLDPFTLYAAYVQAFYMFKVTTSAKSAVIYFKTKPSVPTVPRDVKVTAIGINELIIAWRAPRRANGDSVYYTYKWTPLAWNAATFSQRNYCEHELHIPSTAARVEKEDKAAPIAEATLSEEDACGHCCAACPPSELEKQRVETERHFYADMEALLYDSTSVWAVESLDVDAVVESEIKSTVSGLSHSHELTDGELNVTREKLADNSHSNVSALLQAHITLLHHFQDYLIEVSACQGNVSTDGNARLDMCSGAALLVVRTASHLSADIVDIDSLSVNSFVQAGESLLISWAEPALINGIVLTYDVEIEHTENQAKQLHCVQAAELRERRGININNLPHGHYSVRVRCTSVAGPGPWTSATHFYVARPNSHSWWPIILICVGTLLAVATCVVALICCLLKRHEPGQTMTASANPIYYSINAWAALNKVALEWEIPRDKVTLTRELGRGSFGMVYEGVACEVALASKDQRVPVAVAVKMVIELASSEEKAQLLSEAVFMTQLDCQHIVRLLGIVSKSQPTLVIMELMSGGDLKSYLQHRRPDSEDYTGEPPPQLSDILQMAAEIADGMAYLAAKKYVHRDLAARNCMVSAEGIVKIGDFGLSRDIHQADYYLIGQHGHACRLPIRWMAPESITDQKFSSQSDVWSLGIVLWEITTLGAQPYRGMSNEEVINVVGRKGERLDKPLGCPEPLYELMLMCWRKQPKDRPTFSEIIEILVPYLQPDFRDVSFFFSRENQDLMAASRHNQVSTITLDFSSMCPRTDICFAPDECCQL